MEFTDNLAESILDEIALEGLEGITISGTESKLNVLVLY